MASVLLSSCVIVASSAYERGRKHCCNATITNNGERNAIVKSPTAHTPTTSSIEDRKGSEVQESRTSHPETEIPDDTSGEKLKLLLEEKKQLTDPIAIEEEDYAISAAWNKWIETPKLSLKALGREQELDDLESQRRSRETEESWDRCQALAVRE